MRDSRAPEAKRYGGVRRNVDNAIADEWPAINDDDGDAAAVAEIGDVKMRAERQGAMGGDHAAISGVMILGRLTDPAGLSLRNHKKNS